MSCTARVSIRAAVTGSPQQIGTDLEQPLRHVQPLLRPCCLWAHGQLQAPSQGTAGSPQVRCNAEWLPRQWVRLGQPASVLPGKAAVRQAGLVAARRMLQLSSSRTHNTAHRRPMCKQPVVCAWQPLRPPLPSGGPCTAPEAQHGEQAPCDLSSFSRAHCQLQQHIHHTQHQPSGRLAAAAGTRSASLQDRISLVRALHRRPAASQPATQPELTTTAHAKALLCGILMQTDSGHARLALQGLAYLSWRSHSSTFLSYSCCSAAAFFSASRLACLRRISSSSSFCRAGSLLGSRLLLERRPSLSRPSFSPPRSRSRLSASAPAGAAAELPPFLGGGGSRLSARKSCACCWAEGAAARGCCVAARALTMAMIAPSLSSSSSPSGSVGLPFAVAC